MNFDLVAPCKECPFRNDRPGYLRPARVQEITDAILGDQTFQCHKTLDLPRREHQHCAGATIFLEANDRPNQWMRISERLGFYDRTKMKMDAPVFTDHDDMIEHQRKR